VHVLRQTYHRLGTHFGHNRDVMGLKGNLDSVHLEIVLILTEDGCTVCVERTVGSEIIMDTPMKRLVDEAEVGARLIPFRDNANLDARQVHDLWRTYHRLRNHFGYTR
jgi:hypothetical protein